MDASGEMNFGRTEAIDAAEMISRFVEALSPECAERLGEGNKILRSWRAILESIRTRPRDGEPPEQMGRNLASHSRVIDFKNGILLVEADHSAWLQMLQLHRRYILGCLQRRFPELRVSTLAFRVRGSRASLSDSPADYGASLRAERARQARRYEEEERYLAERGFAPPSPAAAPELPPALREVFGRLRRDVAARSRGE